MDSGDVMPMKRSRDGTILRYGEHSHINADADLLNADWTKQAWDLPFEYGSQEFLGWLKQRGMTLAEFKKLPAYKLAIGD